MSNRNKEYYEFLKVWNRSKGNTPKQRPAVSQRQSAHTGRYLSPKRMREKKRRNRQRLLALVSALALGLLILIIILICKGCSESNDDRTELAGVWHYDQYTEYEFDGIGNGCMCLDGNTHYEFTYTVKDGVLKLDFLLNYVNDCEYTYTIDGDKLGLVGGEGTVGGTYTLTRVEEE